MRPDASLSFMLATLIGSLTSAAGASSPTAVQARGAAAFLDSIGIGTHMGVPPTGSTGTSYGNPSAIVQELRFTGITHVRDSLLIGTSLPALSQLHQALGVKFDLVYDDYTSAGGSSAVTQALANVQSIAASLEAIEGPNEPDWFGIYYNGTTGAPAVVSTQEFLYASVRANAHLSHVPVYCPAFSYPASGGLASRVGDLAPYCDYASLHAYPENLTLGSYPPFEYIAEWATFPPMVTAPGRTVIITEGGWNTRTNGTTGVDEATQSKYILDYLFDAFSQEIPLTYLYELSDDTPDPATTDDEYHFGIFRFDGTPKPAATGLANLRTLLGRSTGTPSSLLYSISDMPANGHQLLLEKGDGTFVLALWNEATLWNAATFTEIPLTPVDVVLTLGSAAASIQVFDPLIGPTAQSTTANAQDLRVAIPDHPILVFIKPPKDD